MKFQDIAIPGKFSSLAPRYEKQAGDKQKPARAGLCQAAIVPAGLYLSGTATLYCLSPLPVTSVIYCIIAIYYCGNITYQSALLPPSERSVRRLKHP
jgi:hypothetical protein